jgi:hypothetical protein
MHCPACFTPGDKHLVPIVQEAGWASGPVWMDRENLTHTRIRTPKMSKIRVITFTRKLENNKNKPRKQAVANFRLNTGHDCLAALLHNMQTEGHSMDKDHLLVCPKLDHTSNELARLYWDARRLME